MLIGQVLMHTDDGGPYYSPWFPRGGNLMSYTVDLIAKLGSATGITVAVETKNSEEADGDATILAITPAATPATVIGPTTFRVGALLNAGTAGSNLGIRELVRFKYTIEGGSAGGDGVHFRMLAPSWLSNGA